MEDLTGQRFGRLTVIRRDEERDFSNIKKGKNGNVHWICRCQCGNQSSVTGYQLKSGGTQSCGCIVSEMTAKRNKECSCKYNHPEKYKDNIIVDSNMNNVLKIYNQERTEFFLIDEQDYDLIKKWYWHKEHKKGYWISNEKIDNVKNGKKWTVRLHQLIAKAKFGEFDTRKLVPDHLSRDTNDNRRCNLVLKTYMDNSHNRGLSKANTSGKTGVYLDKESGKYVANITVNYNTKFLGYYTNFEEAVEARKKAEEQYGFTCDDVKPEYDYETAI